MNTNVYTYSLLKYIHSQVLDEVLNIGLLVYFPSRRKLEFLYPDKLVRLRFAYPNVPEKTIKAYYRSFEDRIEELNAKPELFADYRLEESLDSFISAELISHDSSAIQFGNTKQGLLYTNDTEKIVDQLYNQYFVVFEHHENYSGRLNEAFLLKKYKTLINELSEKNQSVKYNRNIQFDYILKLNDTKQFKFDVAWKNGSTNLVKPISFDVKRKETLQRKAYTFYGQFLDLQDIAEKNNYRFDVLLAKPKDHNLFKSYDSAIDLLQKPRHLKLIEEVELKAYTLKTVGAISNNESAVEVK